MDALAQRRHVVALELEGVGGTTGTVPDSGHGGVFQHHEAFTRALPVHLAGGGRRPQRRPPCSRSGIPAAHRAAAMRAGWPNSRASRRPSVSSPKPSLRSAYCPMFPG